MHVLLSTSFYIFIYKNCNIKNIAISDIYDLNWHNNKNCGLIKYILKGEIILIKTARKKHKLTQKELAERCNLSQSFLSELENKHNKKNVTIKQIVKLANILKINHHELACWFIDKELGVFEVG